LRLYKKGKQAFRWSRSERHSLLSKYHLKCGRRKDTPPEAFTLSENFCGKKFLYAFKEIDLLSSRIVSVEDHDYIKILNRAEMKHAQARSVLTRLKSSRQMFEDPIEQMSKIEKQLRLVNFYHKVYVESIIATPDGFLSSKERNLKRIEHQKDLVAISSNIRDPNAPNISPFDNRYLRIVAFIAIVLLFFGVPNEILY
jgi:hypothetical protein